MVLCMEWGRASRGHVPALWCWWRHDLPQGWAFPLLCFLHVAGYGGTHIPSSQLTLVTVSSVNYLTLFMTVKQEASFYIMT